MHVGLGLPELDELFEETVGRARARASSYEAERDRIAKGDAVLDEIRRGEA
jgi:hypothetical protein